MISQWWLVPIGFAVGTYGTMIGAGGGFVLMPILLLLFPGESPELLASISLAVIFINALSGSVAYGAMKRIDYKAGLMFAAATIPGSIVGALATSMIPRKVFDMLFGVLLVTGGIILALFPDKDGKNPSPPKAGGVRHLLTDREGITYTYTYNPVLGVILSLVVGFFSSLLGIGGGIIHVPALAHLLSFPVHIATATSHFMLSFMALAGTAVHAAKGELAPGLYRILALGIGVLAGAQVGALLSNRIRGVWIMRALALALVFVGARVFIAGLGSS